MEDEHDPQGLHKAGKKPDHNDRAAIRKRNEPIIDKTIIPRLDRDWRKARECSWINLKRRNGKEAADACLQEAPCKEHEAGTAAYRPPAYFHRGKEDNSAFIPCSIVAGSGDTVCAKLFIIG